MSALRVLYLTRNQLTSVPAEIGQLTSLEGCTSRQSADELAGGDRAAHLAEGVVPQRQSADELPAEIGQLTSLRELNLYGNRLTSVPAAAIREAQSGGLLRVLDDGVTFAE